MTLGNVPMKAGGGAKRNAKLEQGTQVTMATQRAATTTKHCHTEKPGEDTYQPLYSPRPAKREGKGRGKLLHKCMIWSSKLHDLPEQLWVPWSSAKTHYVE